MKRIAAFSLTAALASASLALAGDAVATRYNGPCDASAAVALDPAHFVVGNDERDALHIYALGNPEAVGTLDLRKFLATPPREEADIEAAATVGDRIYWITSHARNARGKRQPGRYRFFATEIVPGNPPALRTVGQPYSGLLTDMLAADELAGLGLDEASRRAAEAEGGLNIEGLAATPDGTLLIGLRNPLPRGRALIIPLLNPAQLIEGQRARFGSPVEIDLGNRGIRSIERFGDAYLIVAGPTADRGSFALYRWSGRPADPASTVPGIFLGDLRPEALFVLPGQGRVQLLSDDGGVRIAGTECKKLPARRQAFRSLILDVAP